MTMEPRHLDAIKTRYEVLNSDPWVTEDPGPYVHSIKGVDPEGRSYDVAKWLAPEVARFIVHARTDVPALVAEVERLRALYARWSCPRCGWCRCGSTPDTDEQLREVHGK